MPIPLLGALAIGAAGAGLAQGTASVVQTGKQKKQNKRRIDELVEMRNGGRFALTDSEQSALEANMMGGSRRAAAQARSRGEQLLAAGAAGGTATGGDFARLRQEQAEVVGRGSQETAQAVRQADNERRRELEAELAGREALNSELGNQQVRNVFGALSAGIGTIGAAAGSGVFGVTKEEVDAADAVAQEQPEAVQRAKDAITFRESMAAQQQAIPGGGATLDPIASESLGIDVFQTPDGRFMWRDEFGQLQPLPGM